MSKAELLERLKSTEETILLELLDLSSEDLVDAFLEKIDDNIDHLYRYYD